MKKLLFAIVLFFSCASVFQNTKAQIIDKPSAEQTNVNYDLPKNALNVTPLDFFQNSIGGNFEHLFAVKHGLLIEGYYTFDTKFSGVTGAYRYHFDNVKENNSIISSFFGLFVTSRKVRAEYKDKDKDEKYNIDIKLFTIGLDYGTRYSLWDSFNFAWRVGYGYPFTADFSWSPKKHKDYDSTEKLYRIFMGIDAELSIGIVF